MGIPEKILYLIYLLQTQQILKHLVASHLHSFSLFKIL